MYAFLVILSCLAIGHALPFDDGDEDTVAIYPAETDLNENEISDDKIDLSHFGQEIYGTPSNQTGENILFSSISNVVHVPS